MNIFCIDKIGILIEDNVVFVCYLDFKGNECNCVL